MTQGPDTPDLGRHDRHGAGHGRPTHRRERLAHRQALHRAMACDAVERPPRPSRLAPGLATRVATCLMPPPACERRAAWRHHKAT